MVRQKKHDFSDEQWSKIMRDWESTGLTQKEYCDRKGLSVWLFKDKRKQLGLNKPRQPKPGKFISKPFKALSVAVTRDARYKILLPNGIQLHCSEKFDPNEVRHLSLIAIDRFRHGDESHVWQQLENGYKLCYFCSEI